ncbi:MAG: right-handed parallel beta-helix repeat-containing protein [Candidatus Hinthialibacter antarcticus]|nr:right-handed parallel beta-helix repeat-containing protein [Candidatus Hinthialibacter antarcticus]
MVRFLLFVACLVSGLPCLAAERSGSLSQNETWSLAESPWMITDDLTIEEGATVTIEPGVEVKLGAGVSIEVLGVLNAVGEKDAAISFDRAGARRWGGVSCEEPNGGGRFVYCDIRDGDNVGSGRIGMFNVMGSAYPVEIMNCTFENWPDDFNRKAIHMEDIIDVHISGCYFGEGANEAVHGSNAAALVEYCTFARRYDYSDALDIGDTKRPGPVPIVRKNVFLGSDDDAIDLDNCDAIVDGNLVMNCRGGGNDPIGISGDAGAESIITNNIIINCENGIGFKNGANITVMNNTIIDCDRGIWLHQSAAFAQVINTIIWGRDDQQAVRLERGSGISVIHSILHGSSVYPGSGNSNQWPAFVDYEGGDYHLFPGSPAIAGGASVDDLPDTDFDGRLRRNPIDIGAYVFDEFSACCNWLLH